MEVLNFDFKQTNLVLIVTHLYEKHVNNYTHYSNIKGYLLANGFKDLDFCVCFLTNNDGIILHNNYYYINHSLLTPEALSNFTYIFFILHNKEILRPLKDNTNIFSNIIDAKKINDKLLVINKTCDYPKIIDKFNIKSYDFFDKIFLQTENMIVPKYIAKKNANIDEFLSVKDFNSHCIENNIESKIDYSEMTFNKKLLVSITDEDTKILNISKDKVNLVYMGRLMGGNGMDIIFLMKLMKKLGENYMLYIIPGSFQLPNEFPSKKKSARKPKYLNEFKTFCENYNLDFDKRNLPKYWNEQHFTEEEDDYKICNIKLLPQFQYGKHFGVLKQFDIGLGFSQDKRCMASNGSAKLFDYMCAGLKIVFENGWQNVSYIEKYNFGKVVSVNSTIEDYSNAIKKVVEMDSKEILHDKYMDDHNYLTRAKELIKKIS